MKIAMSFWVCCGDVLPDVYMVCAGVLKWMLDMISLSLLLSSGCFQMSRIFVVSSHPGIGSIGARSIKYSGPIPLSLASLYAEASFMHCSPFSGAHVITG